MEHPPVIYRSFQSCPKENTEKNPYEYKSTQLAHGKGDLQTTVRGSGKIDSHAGLCQPFCLHGWRSCGLYGTSGRFGDAEHGPATVA